MPSTHAVGFEIIHSFFNEEAAAVPFRSVFTHDDSLYGKRVFGHVGSGVGNGTVWRFATVPEPSAVVLTGIATIPATQRMRRSDSSSRACRCSPR
jgi:hypothetical protein